MRIKEAICCTFLGIIKYAYTILKMLRFRTICRWLVACLALLLAIVYVYKSKGQVEVLNTHIGTSYEDLQRSQHAKNTSFNAVEDAMAIAKEIDRKTNKQKNVNQTEVNAETKNKFQPDAVKQRFIERKLFLEEACLRIRNTLKFPECQVNDVQNNIKYVRSQGIVFCAIQKVSSTFWQRILHIAGGWSNASKPVELENEAAYVRDGGFRDFRNANWTDVNTVFEQFQSSSVMFVRDPYARLFSVWLDKYYSPNTVVWKHLSNFAKSQRSYLKGRPPDNACVHDVSFAEFVNFTLNDISSVPCVDGHFSASYKHCMPCNLTYNFIGKYETLQEDTQFLLNHFNLSSKIDISDFKSDATFDAIRDAVNWVYAQELPIRECGITFYCALFKVWRRLQSRGIIATNVDFPYRTRAEANNASRNDFYEQLTLANRNSNEGELNKSREESIAQAFHSLPSELRTQFIDIFKADFQLFGYTQQPEFLIKIKSDKKYFPQCPEGMEFE